MHIPECVTGKAYKNIKEDAAKNASPPPASAPEPPPALEPEPEPEPAVAPSPLPATGPEPASTPELEPAATPAAHAAVKSQGGYPDNPIDRPLVLPPMMLEGRGGLFLFRFSFGGAGFANTTGLDLGAGFGVMDNLEAGIGGNLFYNTIDVGYPILLSPSVKSGDMAVYGKYDLSSLLSAVAGDQLEVAGRLTLNLPFEDGSSFGIGLSTPARYKINDMFAAVGDVSLSTFFASSTVFILGVDVGAMVEPVDKLAIEAKLGLLPASGYGNSSLLVPLFVRGQYTVMDGLDAYASFGFPDLKTLHGHVVFFQVGAAYRYGF